MKVLQNEEVRRYLLEFVPLEADLLRLIGFLPQAPEGAPDTAQLWVTAREIGEIIQALDGLMPRLPESWAKPMRDDLMRLLRVLEACPEYVSP